MTITVRLFARPREICGCDSLQLQLPAAASVRQCFAALVAEHPAMAPMQDRLMAAVNEHYADWHRALADGDTVAFIPPVSGGCGSLPSDG